jgi:hypothetical protein
MVTFLCSSSSRTMRLCCLQSPRGIWETVGKRVWHSPSVRRTGRPDRPSQRKPMVVLPPASQHAALVRAAIAAGKNVYCEWPLTTTVADTEDLLNRAEKAGIRHAVDCNAGWARARATSAIYCPAKKVRTKSARESATSFGCSASIFLAVSCFFPPEEFRNCGLHFQILGSTGPR